MLEFVNHVHRRTIARLHQVAWLGPLLLRVTLGLVFLRTGWGKLHSLDNIEMFFASLDIPAPAFNAVFVSSIEFVGGILLIAGLGTRIVSALLVAVMGVAIVTTQLASIHGVTDLAATTEFAYLAMFVCLVLAGAGKASLDWLVSSRMTRAEPIAAS